MSHYKPYPAYKDSGVEWIGDVPEHWPLLRLANIGSLMKANGGNRQDDTDNGVPCIRYGDLYTIYDLLIRHIGKFISPTAETDYTDIKYGDILFAASGETFEEIGKSAVNLTETYACCGGDVIVLRPQRKIDPVYLAYAAGSSSAQAQKSLMGKGFTVIHIYGNQLRNLVIAAPSEQEQKLIGAKVESETTRIDTLISKKTRFIELLQEKRSVLITHAVTKGLDPNVKMKDSGVEWIGKVPEHWKVRPVKHLYNARLGKMVQPQQKSDGEILVPYHRAQTVQWERVEYDQVERMWANPAEVVAYSLEEGDLLICEGGDVCRAAVFNQVEHERVIFQNSIHRVRSVDGNHPEWLLRLMQHVRSSGWIDVLCNKNTIVHFTSEKLASLECPHPPPAEQAKILSTLRSETARIDSLIAKTQRSIDLLKERRAAFTTAAVTGQIDLRGETA